MAVAQHLYELFLFLIIVCGPAPLCLQAIRISAPPRMPASLPQRLLVGLTTWCLIQTIIAVALGMLHGLALPWILTTEVLIFLGGARPLTHDAARRELGFDRNSWRPLDDLETLTAIAVALVAVTLCWWALAMPVVDYDSWAFHLPAMAQWMQTGTFVRLDQYAQIQGIYPYNWEALCTLFLAPFSEDFMVTFPNLIAWVLLGLSTYLLSRDFGAARIHAFTSSVLLMALPTIVIHVNSMHVDLPFAAFFLVSVHCAIAFQRTRTRAQLALCIATLGFLSGIRTTGPVYAAFVIAFLLAMRVGSRLWPGGVSKTIEPRPCGLPLTIICGVSSLFLAGFWYARNLIDYGNPLGIVAVEIAGVRLFAGATPLTQFSGTTLASAFQPLRLSAWAALVNRVSGELGLPFLVTLLEAATWPLALISRRRRAHALNAIGVLALLGGTGLLFWMTPFGAQTGIAVRLGFPFVSMFAVAAATGASRVRLRPHVPVALTLISATLVIAQSKVLYASVALLIVWGWWARRRPGIQRSRRAILATACLLVAGIVAVTLVARQRRDQERREFYGGFYEYLDRNVREDETLGYLFSVRSYLFYGKHLRRRVLHVPFLSRPGEQWLDELRQSGVNVVALGPWSEQQDDVQLAFQRLDDPHGPFVRVFGRGAPGEVTIYRRDASR